MEDAMSQETVTSVDGTPIAYWRSGDGPSLVLVHGSNTDHTRWSPVLSRFEKRFSVCAVDRRGRGGSGDAAAYSFERECEDIVAVVDSIGGQEVDLLGHSYGAICALEVARRTMHVRKLVLYEPPLPTGIEIVPAAAIDRIETLLEVGAREEALIVFMREVVKMPPHVVDQLRADAAWQGRVAAVHTLPREVRATEGYVLDPARFRDLETPTLILSGGKSPPFLNAATEAVDEALPNSRIVVMPGQGHVAMDTAPDLFITEVLRFLEDP
jgi:pimeloyl-ACP methyl ester carboxylesterase